MQNVKDHKYIFICRQIKHILVFAFMFWKNARHPPQLFLKQKKKT